MNHTSWKESLERIEAQLDQYVRIGADGEPYYVQHPALQRLYKFHDQLITTGLEFGWLDLDINGEFTTEGTLA